MRDYFRSQVDCGDELVLFSQRQEDGSSQKHVLVCSADVGVAHENGLVFERLLIGRSKAFSPTAGLAISQAANDLESG